MPFQTPTLTQIVARLEQDLGISLDLPVARIRRGNAAALARATGGAAFTLQSYIAFIAGQIPYDRAEAELLERWAAIWGISRQAATIADGNVTFTGISGTVIPAGTLLRRADGVEYLTDALATLSAGTATTPVTASIAGDPGNADAGEPLDMVSPIAGVDSVALVAAGGLAGGADAEADEALRARFLDRIRRPPHGGSANDYVQWALENDGVTRAWVYPQEMGIGTVTVRFVMDGRDDIIPESEDVAAVLAYIEERRPVTAEVFVAAPDPVDLNLEIQLTPDNATVRAAVEAELADLLAREAEPGGTILLSHIREAISIAAGESDHVLVSPAANVTHATGEIAVLGTITWSAP